MRQRQGIILRKCGPDPAVGQSAYRASMTSAYFACTTRRLTSELPAGSGGAQKGVRAQYRVSLRTAADPSSNNGPNGGPLGKGGSYAVRKGRAAAPRRRHRGPGRRIGCRRGHGGHRGHARQHSVDVDIDDGHHAVNITVNVTVGEADAQMPEHGQSVAWELEYERVLRGAWPVTGG